MDDVIPNNLDMFLKDFGIRDIEEKKSVAPCMDGRNWKPIIDIVFDEHGEPNF